MKEKLAMERQSLNEKMNKLRIDEMKLEETRRQLDIVRCDLVREQDVLTYREEYLDQRQDELNKRAEVLNQTEKLLKESETRHRRLQDEQSKQFTELQEKNHKLHEMEKQLVLKKLVKKGFCVKIGSIYKIDHSSFSFPDLEKVVSEHF
ncbi:unnamed protein product [Schistosoma curassoni]|uniref:Meiosis-specific nuclear structural protein 1 n=1 Tax=Schistosoma curassoni TaxID=6186 RepID=A0A183L3K9_9TREM|nr:unnamed protein product [Schistosoma curassoni]